MSDTPTNGAVLTERKPQYQLPATAPDFRNLVQAMGYSGYFPDMRSAAQAVVKIESGRELGFGPMASMTNIFIVQGRIALSSGLLASLVKRSGRYSYRVETLTNDVASLVFEERRDGEWRDIGTSTFTIDDAEIAGLLNKPGPWKQYRRNMLFNRALSNGVRWHCPDVAHGPIYLPDEIPAADGKPAQLTPEGGADQDDEPLTDDERDQLDTILEEANART